MLKMSLNIHVEKNTGNIDIFDNIKEYKIKTSRRSNNPCETSYFIAHLCSKSRRGQPFSKTRDRIIPDDMQHKRIIAIHCNNPL